MTRLEWLAQNRHGGNARDIYEHCLGVGKYARIVGREPSAYTPMHDKWQKAKIANLKAVADLAGLRKADLADPAALDAKLAAWIDGLGTAQKIEALRRIGPFWDALFELTEGGLDLNPDEQREIPGDPIYAEPPYIEHGFQPYRDVFEVQRDLAADVAAVAEPLIVTNGG